MAWENIPDWSWSIIRTLLQALKEKDPCTFGHSKRVAALAVQLSEAVGLNEDEMRIIECASLFHDLGKIGIADSILLKPNRLTAKEEAIMRNHPLKGVEIITPLTGIQFFKKAIPGILHHHERIDGEGYPEGITGDKVPLSARIILIADTYDAMTTSRPYRNALPSEVAYKELKLYAGTQFDEKLVKVFLEAHPTWKTVDEDLTDILVAIPGKKAA